MKTFLKENLPYILIPFLAVMLLALGGYIYFTYFDDGGTSPFVYTF